MNDEHKTRTVCSDLQDSEESRAVVYNTALLVGVGVGAHAPEQAQWLGDDIAHKSIKY